MLCAHHFYNTFTTNYRWYIKINFNLNSQLILFFYPSITVNNNLQRSICWESIADIKIVSLESERPVRPVATLGIFLRVFLGGLALLQFFFFRFFVTIFSFLDFSSKFFLAFSFCLKVMLWIPFWTLFQFVKWNRIFRYQSISIYRFKVFRGF